MMSTKYWLSSLLGVSVLALSGCGGGSDGLSASDTNTNAATSNLGAATAVTTIKVVGDSLNDSGTFGIKFTTQSNPASASKTWLDWVTASLGKPNVCSRYSNALAVQANACTSFAVAGATINPTGTTSDATPMSVIQQIKDLSANSAPSSGDLFLIDGGGNDIANLATGLFAALRGSPSSFRSLLIEALPSSAVDASIATTSGPPQLGLAYVRVLAQRMKSTITTELLDKGALRVVIVDIPDVTLTPKFRTILGTLSASSAASVKDIIGLTWVNGYNDQLRELFRGDSRVIFVSFPLKTWTDNATQYGFTNVTGAFCTPTGTDTNTGLPTYTIATCADSTTAKTYIYADDFHGTQYANELFGKVAAQAISDMGWK